MRRLDAHNDECHQHIRELLIENTYLRAITTELSVDKDCRSKRLRHDYCDYGDYKYNENSVDEMISKSSSMKEAKVESVFFLEISEKGFCAKVQERIGERKHATNQEFYQIVPQKQKNLKKIIVHAK